MRHSGRGFVSIMGVVVAAAGLLLGRVEMNGDALHASAMLILTQPVLTDLQFEALEANEIAAKTLLMQPSEARDRATVVEARAERALANGERGNLGENLRLADRAIANALELAPFDSYLWLMSYRVKTLREGPSASSVERLAASYRTGPMEGWLAIRRSYLAFAILPLLPADLEHAVYQEFAGLVRSGAIDVSVGLLTGPAWSYRSQSLAALEQVPIASRRLLSARLRTLGYRVAVPGIGSFAEIRPWQRTCQRQGPANKGGICL